ncbi:MAG: NAD(P)-dependent alcohol dehydrogenase [Verrucomicrobiales bacterium]|nr:NAD(P)-dependent alcohol dehydrogenase [Verrucomicrobiae bacterium]MCP5552782.1 NAD(P)-dependent alcohol dehydrogenase [Akkermansiaceae bacterium]
MTIRAHAATQPGNTLVPYEYDPGPLGRGEVEVQVETCGICHSDLSMLQNDWGQTTYPLVPGHEAIGIIVAADEHALGLRIGQRVGVGWFAGACQICPQCVSGRQNLCANAAQTIVGRHGGFADRVRCHWTWAIPLPEALSAATAGPLFCGGITVFGPIVECGVRPTDRVGVIGMGGLGHLAVQFLAKWGCEVTVFSSHPEKAEEALQLGAHHVVNSRDLGAIKAQEGSLQFILSTVNVPLDWSAYLAALTPGGRLHLVGAVLEPLAVPAFALIGGAKSVSGSPLGSPATVGTMLEFCARHGIAPVTETFPMSQVNEAIAHLEAGKARYRIVLENDFA